MILMIPPSYLHCTLHICTFIHGMIYRAFSFVIVDSEGRMVVFVDRQFSINCRKKIKNTPARGTNIYIFSLSSIR